MRTSFNVSVGLSALVVIIALAAVPWIRRLQRDARQTAITGGKLGQYVLDEPIGEGGYAMVYRARHALLRRPVALKILKPTATSQLTIARFEREVQTTSHLTHPNTVAIFDYGHTVEGLFYYAMEYLDGISLRDLVARFGPLPEGRVIYILRQICGSLAEAHNLGLVHRDISPRNIILNRRGGQGDVVKVLDFGLVKAVDPQLQFTLTLNESALGTPQYMLMLSCLAKDKASRPLSAVALDEALAACATATQWNASRATDWWLAQLPATKSPTPAAFQERTLVVSPQSQTRAGGSPPK